ncbi:MAG TPA: outer membrane beta-barrel protein [Gemmatimonadaceae bacterium]|nr:outer membrane beta-barrel protein [Gemmatimonadaceae bacterium]
MRRTLPLALGVAAIALAAQSASAQTSQRFSVQGSGLFAGLFGSAFDDFKDGVGGELQLRYTPGVWSLGVGVQYTVHNTTAGAEGVIDKVKLLGFFFEPRYVIDAGSAKFAPYVSARLAMSSMHLDLSPDLAEPGITLTVQRPTGPTINGGGGILFKLNSRVNLDVGATYGYTKFNKITITATNDAGQSESEKFDVGHGTNIVARIGFAIGIGG